MGAYVAIDCQRYFSRVIWTCCVGGVKLRKPSIWGQIVTWELQYVRCRKRGLIKVTRDDYVNIPYVHLFLVSPVKRGHRETLRAGELPRGW